MKKLFAFLGLLVVIYALALQHGVFDHAAAAARPDAAASRTGAATDAVKGAGAGTSSRADSAASAASAGSSGAGYSRSPPSARDCDDNSLTAAYRKHQSRVKVCGHGVIAKVLRDDTQGTRHQKFVVRLPPGQTVLVAYNYDLAPRIDGLRTGSPVEFVGEYEWNGQGGVVHWTHRDPEGHHPPGWIRYAGKQYQ